MTIQDNVYYNITRLCREQNIKISELEKKCKVAVGHFARIGERQTDFRVLPVLTACEILGVTIDEVIYGR